MPRALSHLRLHPRRSLLLTLGLTLVATAAPAPEASETMAEKTLREIVRREQEMFAKAEKEGDALDEARFIGEAKALAGSYDVLLQQNPDFVPALVAYGLLLDQLDMARAAAAMLVRANKLDPNLPLVKNQLAKLMAEDGKPLEALPYVTSAIALAPREPLYHYHLGRLLLAAHDDFVGTGQFTRARLDEMMLAAFAQAAELAPDNWEYAYQHAKAYYELETPRWEEALAAWERLTGRATTEVLRQLTKLHRANLHVLAGHPDEARRLLAAVTAPQFAEEKTRVEAALAAAAAPPVASAPPVALAAPPAPPATANGSPADAATVPVEPSSAAATAPPAVLDGAPAAASAPPVAAPPPAAPPGG